MKKLKEVFSLQSSVFSLQSSVFSKAHILRRNFSIIAIIAILGLVLSACRSPTGPEYVYYVPTPTCTHVWGEWTPEGSCTEYVEQTRTCTVPGCNETQTRMVAPLGHIAPDGYPPTCTTDGYTGSGECTRCGEHVAGEVIPALGHDFDDWTVRTPATCTTAGEEIRTCQREGCDYYEQQVIPIDPNAHDLPDVWTVRTPATCAIAGEEIRACQRVGCDYYVSRVIPVLDHIINTDWVRTGFYPLQETSQKCSICGTVMATFTPGGIHVLQSLITPGAAHYNKYMVRIPAGTITALLDHVTGVRQITQEHDFWMSRTPVTRAQWLALMPSAWGTGAASNMVATHINWFMAIEFANRLSIDRGLTPVYSIPDEDGVFTTNPALWGARPGTNSGDPWNRWSQVQKNLAADGYRLPTKYEWEYAARAGTTTAFNDGVTDGWTAAYNTAIGRLARFNEFFVPVVASRVPNAWGLFDMHGLVWEHCWEFDPRSDLGYMRVMRGGSFAIGPGDARSSNWTSLNMWHTTGVSNNAVGIRLVRSNVN